jgi:large subunit ribosomal protein L9
MQVMLLKDVEGLGRAGEVKNVAGGYGQNYLVPRKLAVPANEGALRQAKLVRDATERRQDRQVNAAKDLATRLDGQSVVFRARAGEGDRLYGSVTAQDIADSLQQTTGLKVDRRFLEIEHPLKSLGEHKVALRMGAGAIANIYVRIERAVAEE